VIAAAGPLGRYLGGDGLQAIEIGTDEAPRLQRFFEANPDYFRGPPTVRRVSFKVIPDATTRALELRKGSVDIGQNVLPPDFVKGLKTSRIDFTKALARGLAFVRAVRGASARGRRTR